LKSGWEKKSASEMYFILSYFPTWSLVLCIGDTTQYSESEMRYGAYRDKTGFASLLLSSLALAKNKSRKKLH
jgi:hypothetical protein